MKFQAYIFKDFEKSRGQNDFLKILKLTLRKNGSDVVVETLTSLRHYKVT